jgi:hypothetical protein
MPPRLFTLDEALRLLTVVRRLVTEIQAAKASVVDASARLESLLERTGGNGHFAGQIEEARAAVQTAMTDMQALISELEEMGVELKDIEEGLVDFRSMREGRIVYLCWRQGEDTIGFWHELDAGFPGRQPL